MKVRLYPLTAPSGNYASQIYTGLFDLEYQKKIELEIVCNPLFSICEDSRFGDGRSHLVYLEIIDKKGLLIRVCYDLYDSGDIVAPKVLRTCDIYFKRSYSKDQIQSNIDSDLMAKIYPYGLFQTARSRNEHSNIWRMFAFIIHTKLWVSKPIRAMRLLGREIIGKAKPTYYLETASESYECEPNIFFQTRVFEPGSTSAPEKTLTANKLRVDIIRALKKEFGENFVGGLLPESYASKMYPDILTQESTKKQDYLMLMKKCEICVVTKGLEESIPQKMAENIALSRCIISETMSYELPAPLQNNQNVIYFDDVEECVKACRMLIEEKNFRKRMREENKKYYNMYVTPHKIVFNTLQIARKGIIMQCQI